MSTGHRHRHGHSQALLRELTRVLADKRVVAYLARPFRVDFGHEMPLTGGSNRAGDVYYLDPKLKHRYAVGPKAGQDLSGPVLRHERVEKALRVVFGMSYPRAHSLATAAERIEVEKMGLSWRPYLRVMESIVRRDENEHPKSLPRDYDTGPVRESVGVKHLAWLRNRVA